MHHVAEAQNPNAYACGSKCIEAAIEAVHIADALQARGMLNEAYALTMDVLAMAAISLLVVELGAPTNGNCVVDVVKRASRHAKTLLDALAKTNITAAQCLESLMVSTCYNIPLWSGYEGTLCVERSATNSLLQPFYRSVTQSSSSTVVSTKEMMQDFTLYPTENSELLVFDSQLGSFDSSIYMANPSNGSVSTLDYPASSWPDWTTQYYAAPNLV